MAAHRIARRLLCAATLLGLAAACAVDPVLQIERQRSRYTASVGSFVVRDDPATGRQEIVLDVLVRFDGSEPLPGLTLDLSMADPARREKAHRRVWIEVAGIQKGPGSQLTVTLDDLPYQSGDGFFVEVRTPVPAAERSEYREFAGAR
jgi:hypothetical protein